MTELLEQVIARLKSMPADEQDVIASFLMPRIAIAEILRLKCDRFDVGKLLACTGLAGSSHS